MKEKKISEFWNGRLDDYWLSQRKGSAWKIVQVIIFKYDFPIQIMGLPAMIPAKKILDEYKDKLDEKEIEFLKKVVSGEYIK